MPDKPIGNLNDPKPFTGASAAAAREKSRGEQQRGLDNSGPDPFIEEMTDVAGHTTMDGNAGVDSPQAITNSEGSPGNSR